MSHNNPLNRKKKTYKPREQSQNDHEDGKKE